MATKTIVTFKNTEDALMNVRGAEPKVDSDFTTKNYVDGIFSYDSTTKTLSITIA